MDKESVNITIIGGCMLGQHYLGLSNLFYRRIARTLKETYALEVNFRLVAYTDLVEIREKVLNESLRNPDLILLQLRPAQLYKRLNLILKTPERFKVSEGKYVLNPLITKKDLQDFFKPAYSPNASEPKPALKNPFNRKPSVVSTMIASLNLSGGLLAGSEKTASRLITDELEAIEDIMNRSNIPMLAIGFLNSFIIKRRNRAVKRLDGRLKARFTERSLKYVSIVNELEEESKTNPTFLNDYFHLNGNGHRIIAESVTRAIEALYHLQARKRES